MDKGVFTAAVAIIAGASVYWLYATAQQVAATTGEDYGIGDAAGDAVSELTAQFENMVAPGSAAVMDISPQGEAWLKQRESLRLTKYVLGDGGETIGYGHWGPFGTLPDSITQAQADALFDSDVQQRAAKWVRLYVTAPVTQQQFDALCSIAYNMSPKSFRHFADAVNAGQGIDGVAQASVSWVATNLQNGISNRRATEMALFDSGVYA
ncbi:lysozyme [Paraburkholderia hospita]|uniref:lysozyme n=1 Tax=Paraburkholderia hospita TaxID=169430 RepID=UPI0009A8ED26|nr:lysozyme [Paraburkholderia hospita]SKC92265.1 Phage-related lysozyme (muramidase), GH24 family [Paraburkholderia hospita]